jgi:hypothetical protein
MRVETSAHRATTSGPASIADASGMHTSSGRSAIRLSVVSIVNL